MMRNLWMRFVALLSYICLLTPCCVSVAYASEVNNNYYQMYYSYIDNGVENYLYSAGRCVTDAPVYLYIGRRPSNEYLMYFVSASTFKYSSITPLLFNSEIEQLSQTTLGVKLLSASSTSGVYYGKVNYNFQDSPFYDTFSMRTDVPIVYFDGSLSALPWEDSDFVVGEGAEDPVDTTKIVYDSSIPAPENLKFEERSKSFGFLTGSKFEHCLTWSNGLSTPPLNVRVSAVADCMYNDTGQSVPDSMLELLSASRSGVRGDIGTFTATADDIKSKILDGTTLVSILEYRVQFYRYDADGKLCVGPLSTVRLNYNKLGKYIGYTVTTDTPKDETNLGQSGGMDDYYQDNWTSDGEHYDEYDKNGNLVDSGTSDDKGNILQRLINGLVNIPTVINEFFKGIQSLMTGIGEFPALLSRLFAFLPPEIIALVGLGISLVIVLRILGR